MTEKVNYTLPLYSIERNYKQHFSSYHLGRGTYELGIWTKKPDYRGALTWGYINIGTVSGGKQAMQGAIGDLRLKTGLRLPYFAQWDRLTAN